MHLLLADEHAACNVALLDISVIVGRVCANGLQASLHPGLPRTVRAAVHQAQKTRLVGIRKTRCLLRRASFSVPPLRATASRSRILQRAKRQPARPLLKISKTQLGKLVCKIGSIETLAACT